MELERFSYDNKIVKQFGIATIVWGVVGMLVGLLIASQLFYPALNFNLQYTTFGRIRPIHTNAVIFAFVGNAIFMGVYHSLQRFCKARMYSDLLSKIHFWGWQLIIVAAAVTLALGFTTRKEYAELEWPIDIAIIDLGCIRHEYVRNNFKEKRKTYLCCNMVLHCHLGYCCRSAYCKFN